MCSLKIKGTVLLLSDLDRLQQGQKGWISYTAIRITESGTVYLSKTTKCFIDEEATTNYTIPIFRDKEGDIVIDMSECTFALYPIKAEEENEYLKNKNNWYICNSEVELLGSDAESWYKRYSIDTLYTLLENAFLNLETKNLDTISKYLISKIESANDHEEIEDIYDYCKKDFPKEMENVDFEEANLSKAEYEREMKKFYKVWPTFEQKFSEVAQSAKKRLNDLSNTEKELDYAQLSDAEITNLMEEASAAENYDKAAELREILASRKK